ncbi:MAG: gephyrin-like molybdotransferase Glp [Pirellulaceae bacterium]
MLSVNEALKLIKQHVTVLADEAVGLSDAIGRVLATDCHSTLDSPPYDKSMVDGYAIRSADLTESGGQFQILEEVIAGAVPTQSISQDTTTAIMTGAPIPKGADAVIMVEYSTRHPESPDVVVLNHDPVNAGTNILYQGTTLKVGDKVLQAGHAISPATVGLLAELGVSAPNVFRLANVAILSTGDELVPIDQQPGPGQIRNSNGPLLQSLVRNAGAVDRVLGVGRDNLDQLESLIQEGLNCEILVLSGGVSAGVKDLVPQALSNLGVKEIFHKVNLKPGKPLWFGIAESDDRKRLVFGLPGNPVSSMVCFLLFVVPAIRALHGGSFAPLSSMRATLTETFKQRGDRPTYYPGVMESSDDGIIVKPLRWKGSADQLTLTMANCLVCFPAGVGEFSASEDVSVFPLPW